MKAKTFSEKFIIENRCADISPMMALERVLQVMERGKISKTSKGEQYCFATTFSDNTIIYADKNKKSDRFVISDIDPRNPQGSTELKITGIKKK